MVVTRIPSSVLRILLPELFCPAPYHLMTPRYKPNAGSRCFDCDSDQELGHLEIHDNLNVRLLPHCC